MLLENVLIEPNKPSNRGIDFSTTLQAFFSTCKVTTSIKGIFHKDTISCEIILQIQKVVLQDNKRMN